MKDIIEAAANRKEMEDHFRKRTDRHIKLVQKYCKRLSARVEGFSGIIKRGEDHDLSKFKEPELEPYIHLTWNYKCKDDGVEFKMPEGMEDRVHEATKHHIVSNAHHPECHDPGFGDENLNRDDRDKPPGRMVDGTKMGDMDIAEQVCDWCAMGEERGNTPTKWAKQNVNVRWKFTPKQEKLIYDLIDKIWG